MKRVLNYLRDIPAGAKAAIAALFVGWALHLAVYFHSFTADMTDRTVFLQLVVGAGICCAVATGRRWARMLCVFFNIGIVALYALFSLALFQSAEWGQACLTALIAVIFTVATVFLLTRGSARFFNPPLAPAADSREPNRG
ncbi:MAG: hypothetical protein MUD16_13215 [Desulfobacterales bacterium]|jgi:hypothetical protein|nr:hypothetical protein [Desulfobacterales bacterium]